MTDIATHRRTPPGLDTLALRRWPDVVIDDIGHAPTSMYPELFWLPVMGPTSLWLLRRLVFLLEGADADVITVDAGELAACIGVSNRGRQSPLRRALDRLAMFGLVHFDPDGTVAVHCMLPPLTLRRVHHLPPALQESHGRWQADELKAVAS